MLSSAPFYLPLQCLQYDAVTDLTTVIWSRHPCTEVPRKVCDEGVQNNSASLQHQRHAFDVKYAKSCFELLHHQLFLCSFKQTFTADSRNRVCDSAEFQRLHSTEGEMKLNQPFPPQLRSV
ncbi:hypothetical protein J6590_033777 [Homalodisca vitripennis]|nr:hypothetical protein J6590_033777 [Homalodisca vitripennis]